ncbi:MAG: rRNA (cytidine-2'-O-)-methyltransferase, partial [Gammaproteobacteria bacterium]|nr:rRNA (cytidine-2'-O-)-methyltransferase [Gammaproteobacteria bacterium]MBT4812733.1 rRNA (cytidine-2'-O-)-methyltransferase [Thiotrichales bacterium]
DANRQRGEFVLVVEGAVEQQDDTEAYRMVKILAKELPPRKAAALAAEITGVKKNQLYRSLME